MRDAAHTGVVTKAMVRTAVQTRNIENMKNSLDQVIIDSPFRAGRKALC